MMLKNNYRFGVTCEVYIFFEGLLTVLTSQQGVLSAWRFQLH